METSEQTTPCQHCGHPFDQELLGPHGCPNCHGEGLEPDEPAPR